jgi:hypothetical protein
MCLSRTELRLWETNDIIIKRVFLCALRETMDVAVLTAKLVPFGTTFINSFLSFFLSLAFLPTHCVCRGVLLHMITLIDTHTHTHTYTYAHTLVATPLDEGSVRLTDLYIITHNTHKRKHPRTRNASKREAADPRLRSVDNSRYFWSTLPG